MPCLRRCQLTPPFSVRPATPVWETTPPGVARPKRCVAVSTSAQVAPPWTQARRALGVDVDGAHLGQVDDERAVGDGAAGDVVAAAADGERDVVLAGEGDGGDDVGGAARSGR